LPRSVLAVLAISNRYNEAMVKEWPPELPIWSDPERLGGAPCFLHTRVPVDALFANLEDGVSLDEFLDAFQGVKREHVLAILEYARKLFAAEAA
jgi:uncharacterized protein (DUF433 family)